VWENSLALGQELLSIRTGNTEVSTVATIGPDIDFLVLRIIISVGFGVTARLGDEDQHPGLPNAVSTSRFAAALDEVITNLPKLLIFPERILEHGPKSWRSIQRSARDVRAFIDKLIQVELQKQNRNEAALEGYNEPDNILLKLIEQADYLGAQKEREEKGSLSRAEVIGNAFILAFAGANSTADSLKYSIVLMALHPDIQEWLIEDIDQAFDNDQRPETGADWKMETLLPKLIATFCVMVSLYRIGVPC
jgi:cytochrome P450